MKKKIMVLTGSPRKEGNSDALANAFIKGAMQAGNDIVKYDVADNRVNGCVVCDTCFSKGKACTLDSTFSDFADLVEDVDALVIVTPLYWFTFPAQLKAVIDKFYAFILAEKKLNIKDAMLLTCGELEDDKVFDGVIKSYKQICKYHGWYNKGTLVVPGGIR